MTKYIFHLLILIIILPSCKKNFLDKGPDEDLTIDQAFTDRLNTERFQISVYGYLPRDLLFANLEQVNPLIASTDELEVPWEDEFAQLMNNAAWSASNVPSGAWSEPYRGIRQANIFLENVGRSPLTDEEKKHWSAEVIFLRAFYHFNLMKLFGPIPIIDHVITSDADYTAYKRQPLNDVVNFIASELDKAAADLPIRVSEVALSGRATRGAALALKARLYLYAASPLWNGNPDYANVKDHEGVQLFPTTADAGKWQTAADAAKKCIDECEAAGHGLYRSGSNNPVLNYQEIFLNDWNKEVIYAFNNPADGYNGWVEKCASPRGMGGWSGWAPSQNIIDAYEMNNGMAPITGYNTDGTPIINVASGYVETGYAATDGPANTWLSGVRNMYVNRDPRFYATVHFSGSYWRTRRLEFWKTGLDGQIGEGYTKTGYLLKKFSDPAADVLNGRFTFFSSIYFRLAEIYLNYAEALNEAQGPVADVHKYVNLVRDRSGMPALDAGLSKEAMRDRIRHERRIELAYETHRYFDMHRWKTAPASESGPLRGLTISAGASMQDNAFYVRRVVENRIFVPNNYLWPIPQAEINKNQSLVQNPGW